MEHIQLIIECTLIRENMGLLTRMLNEDSSVYISYRNLPHYTTMCEELRFLET